MKQKYKITQKHLTNTFQKKLIADTYKKISPNPDTEKLKFH